jgi:phage terminase small subunit
VTDASETTDPCPPDHLGRSAGFWAVTVAGFDLDPHQLELLRRACEASDRADEARETIDADGACYVDRWGQPKAHPMIAVERDSRLAFARLIRELKLDDDGPASESRPPRTRGRY